MIHYALRCCDGHEFDGWFASSASFEAQALAALLDCPVCASKTISRALMAPRIASGAVIEHGPQQSPAPPAAETQAIAAKSGALMPAHVRAALQRIRTEVERRCEYVGPRFATEVRRIAEGDVASARPIYGEATPEEAAALADDGIEVARIPWVARADS